MTSGVRAAAAVSSSSCHLQSTFNLYSIFTQSSSDFDQKMEIFFSPIDSVPKAGLNRAVSWSELSSDLLGDIMGRLCLIDQARFHAVCKSWRHVCPINKSHAVFKPRGRASLFSWFVRVVRKPSSTLEFRLYEPCHSIHDPISVHTISLSELDIPNPSSSWTYIRIFCQNNWLFISFTDREQGRCDQIHFILFSPLTKTLKQLPPCLHSWLGYFDQSFSSDPESADCVFLLVDTLSCHGKFTVATYRKDDENWTVRQITKAQNFPGTSTCNTMYTGGIFYIVSPCGQVASYDVINEEINFESLIRDDNLASIYSSGWQYDLFVVKGELMYIIYRSDISCTKRFDRLKKRWIPAGSLQDSAIIDNEKPNSVEKYMTAFFNFGCLICSSESFALDQFSPNSFRFNFRPTISVSGSFIWLKPPVIQ